MSEAIPQPQPASRNGHLANAKAAFEEAVAPVLDPAIRHLGDLVVRDAEFLTKADEEGVRLAEQTADDLHALGGIGDQAESFLRDREVAHAYEIANITGDRVPPQQDKTSRIGLDLAEFSGLIPGRAQARENIKQAYPEALVAPLEGQPTPPNSTHDHRLNDEWASAAMLNKMRFDAMANAAVSQPGKPAAASGIQAETWGIAVQNERQIQ